MRAYNQKEKREVRKGTNMRTWGRKKGTVLKKRGKGSFVETLMSP